MNHKNKVIKILTMVSVLVLGTSAASIAQAKTYKMALGDAQGGTQYELGQKFAELFKQKTRGKHRIKLFANGQLGSEQDTVNDAAIGTLDFSVLAINNVTPFSPTVGLLTLPYMIQSLDDAVTLTQGPVGKGLVKNTIRDAGVRVVGWAYSGFRVLTNSKRPIRSLRDLKGVVVRVPKNEIMIDTYKAWGINPTPMAWSETFTALQQRVVDGQDNPYITVHAMKFNEVQKYVTNIRYLFSIEPLIISEAIFQDMKPSLQKAVLEAGKEATDHSEQFLRSAEARIKRDLESKGMQIVQPANNEKEWIDRAVSQVWPKYYDSIGGKARLNAVLRSLGRETVK